MFLLGEFLGDEVAEGLEDVGICYNAGDSCDVSPLAGGEGFVVEEDIEAQEEFFGFLVLGFDLGDDEAGGFDLVFLVLLEQLLEKRRFGLHYIIMLKKYSWIYID